MSFLLFIINPPILFIVVLLLFTQLVAHQTLVQAEAAYLQLVLPISAFFQMAKLVLYSEHLLSFGFIFH